MAASESLPPRRLPLRVEQAPQRTRVARMAKKRSAGSLSAKLDIKRVYAPPDPSDGLRILVDRLWPRGLAKEKAKIDLWLKDIAPSDALRRAVHGKLVDWEQFLAEYARELAQAPAGGARKF